MIETRTVESSIASQVTRSRRKALGNHVISLRCRRSDAWSISGPATSTKGITDPPLIVIMPVPLEVAVAPPDDGDARDRDRGVPDEPGRLHRVPLLGDKRKRHAIRGGPHSASLAEADGVDQRPPDDTGIAQVALGRLREAGQHLLGHERRVVGSGPVEQAAAIRIDETAEPPAGRDEQGGEAGEEGHLDEGKADEHAEHRRSLRAARGRRR